MHEDGAAVNDAVFERVMPEDYLMRLAASDMGRSYKALVTGELSIQPGHVVLDLGCGPGADLAAFAAATGKTGRVIAVDRDPRALERARRLVNGPASIDLRLADIHALDLPDRTVDRVHTDRVLQHVTDPLTVLREARRVLTPSGRAVFAEPDWDTLIIDSDDLEVSRGFRRFIIERVVRNACIARQLPRLAQQAGFRVINTVPITTVFDNLTSADQILGLHRVAHRAIAAGYLTGPATTDWLTRMSRGPFFAAVTLFVNVADTQPR